MASGRLIDYLGEGLFSARPVTPNLAAGALGLYYATDTNVLYGWDGSAWDVVGGNNSPITVTTPETGTALTATGANAWNYTRFTNAGTKTYTFDSAQTYINNAEYHGRNVGAGNLTIAQAGSFVITPPVGGSLVIPQGQSFFLKITGTNTADLILQSPSGTGPPPSTPATLADPLNAVGASSTTHTYTFPATVNAGDIIVLFYVNATSAAVTDSGLFVRQVFNAGRAVYTRVCTGTEGGTTVNIGTVASAAAWTTHSLRVVAGTFDATNPLGISSAASSAPWALPAPTAPAGGWNGTGVQWISGMLAASAASTYAYAFANNRFPAVASTSSRTAAVSTEAMSSTVVAGRGLADSISVSTLVVLVGINPLP